MHYTGMIFIFGTQLISFCFVLLYYFCLAAGLGVDIDELLVSQPDSGEMALDIVDQLVRSAAVDLIVVDSVAALVPR
jgi:hypothetical protein